MPTPRNTRKSPSNVLVVDFPHVSNDDLVAQFVRSRLSNDLWRPATASIRTMQLRRIAADLAPAHFIDVTEDRIEAWYENLPGQPETRASYASALQ